MRGRGRFRRQAEPRGYGHAILCGRAFVGDESFLHLVGDHLHVAHASTGCARQLIDVAVAEQASVSAVQATRESQLTAFGAVGGRLVGGERPLYQVETVLEQPTSHVACRPATVPGLGVWSYLSFFRRHARHSERLDPSAEQAGGGEGDEERGLHGGCEEFEGLKSKGLEIAP